MSTPSSASVPASPVVRIEIFGSTVSVNGVVILHDGTQPLHQVAIQAASDRVAKPLGRPVRALATDAEGSASMVVHPDGRATDVELMEAEEVPPAAPDAAPATAPMFAQLDPSALPSGPPPPPPVVAPAERTAAPVPTARPVAGTSRTWPSRLVRSIALAAALVAVVGMGVLLLGSRDDDADTASDRSGETSPVAAGASETAAAEGQAETTFEVPGQDDTPEVAVTPMPGAKALRLTITSTLYPTTAIVEVTGRNKPIDVAIKGDTTEVEVDRLTPGTVEWSVAVPGAPLQSGSVEISATFVAPTPAPTETAAPVTETVDPALVQAQAEARAAKQAARQAEREARQAQQQAEKQVQAKQQQKANQQQAKKSKKTEKKVKTGFGKVKKTRTGFAD